MTDVDIGFVHRFDAAEVPGLPTLLLLHGTGGDEDDLIPLGHILLPGGALLSPRGNVRENGTPRFFRRLAEGVFDLEDLRRQTSALAEFIVAAAAIYAFDPTQVVAVGFSNGANMAVNLLLSHPGILAGAIVFHAQLPAEPAEKPDLAGTPVLMTGGRTDTMIPAVQTENLAVVLRDAGAQLTIHWEPGGHALVPPEVAAAQEWLRGAFIKKIV